MNPLDFWYQGNTEIQRYYREYYDKNRDRVDGELGKDISQMFEEGNVIEKVWRLRRSVRQSYIFKEPGN